MRSIKNYACQNPCLEEEIYRIYIKYMLQRNSCTYIIECS